MFDLEPDSGYPPPPAICWRCRTCGHTVYAAAMPRCRFSAHGHMEPMEGW